MGKRGKGQEVIKTGRKKLMRREEVRNRGKKRNRSETRKRRERRRRRRRTRTKMGTRRRRRKDDSNKILMPADARIKNVKPETIRG